MEAGKRLGISAQAVGMWAKRPGAPVVEVKGKPRLVWPDFPRWREKELERQAKTEAAPTTFDEAKTRKIAAEAELAELELAKERGSLIPIALHGERLAKILERVRARLVAIPGKVAPRLVGVASATEAQAMVNEAVAESLEELSR